MPRVLRILNRLIIGGPAINATYLTRYMAPEFETRLVIGGKDDHEQDATHLTERLDIRPSVIPEMKRAISLAEDRAAYLKMKALIREFRPDIVHTHAAKSGAIGRLAAKACGVPVVVHTFHGHVFHSYFGKTKTRAFIEIEKYLARRSSGIIAISDIQKEELSGIYKICAPEKIRVIPLGLDLDRFREDQDRKRAAFRERYFIADDEIAIGIVGRIVSVKNHSLFVAAAAKLVAGTGRKVRFIIVGDGDSRPQMEQEFRAAGIDYAYFLSEQRAATAICTSWLTNVDEVLAGVDMAVLTSHNEGTPVSMIEAQAAARPVISTNVGGVADIILDGQTGFVTPPGDVAAFGDAMVRLVNDDTLRAQLAAAGRAHVQDKYSYQRLVRDMSSYYHELLAKHRR